MYHGETGFITLIATTMIDIIMYSGEQSTPNTNTRVLCINFGFNVRWSCYARVQNVFLHACLIHYNDVIMVTMASHIISPAIVHTAVYSGADQRKHQCSASVAFVWGIHRLPVNSQHKWPVTRIMSLFDDVIMRQNIGNDKPFGKNECTSPNVPKWLDHPLALQSGRGITEVNFRIRLISQPVFLFCYIVLQYYLLFYIDIILTLSIR